MSPDAASAPSNSSVRILTDVDGSVFFSPYQHGLGRSLWKTDGTSSGTLFVKDGFSDVAALDAASVGSRLFFRADDGVHGDELWISDGTGPGTELLMDIRPGSGNSLPRGLIDVNGLVLFSANNGSDIEIWRSDGTASGTQVRASLGAADFVRSGELIFFRSSDPWADALWTLTPTPLP